MWKLKAADLFCGAGGTSIGAEQSGAARVRFAVNHWDVAVETHSANFPNAKHVNSRLDQVRPSECPKIDLLFASPECTHHSRARGGKPTSDQQRAGAFELLPWIEHHRPSFVVVENVIEFEQWGPVGDNGRPLKSKVGALFHSWIKSIEACGYNVGWQRLNAADFGAATSRNRLFVVARKGNRRFNFPDPTHARNPVDGLFDSLKPWRGAREVIDWSLPCPSIFSRKRPLADKTLLRIEAGLRRFVEPFVVRFRNNMDASGIGDPVGTVSAGGGHHGVAVPMVRSTHISGEYQTPDEPVPTIRARNGAQVAVPFLQNVNHGENGEVNGRTADLNSPLGTVTSHNGRAIVLPFLDAYYGNGHQSPIDGPLPTVVTKDRHSLITVLIDPAGTPPGNPTSDAMRKLVATMAELGVVDIGFRMLANHELAAAQGFPDDYVFHGCKSAVTRQIGNSVSPAVAKALTEACAA